MIRIVNWLLTRRCNLSCEYCGIIRKSKIMNDTDLKLELPANEVIKLLDKFRTYNPNIFHIFYGGEPFLRRDLSDIIKFCNEKDILYTIISNSARDIQPTILDVMEEAGGFRGYSTSIDPILLMEPTDRISQLKSSYGFNFLLKLKKVNDLVAEVTMTKYNIDHTYDLIKMLSDYGIYSSLTAIDINKNYMYDFSAYSAEDRLIKHSPKIMKLFTKIMNDDSLLIHMKEEIVPLLFSHINSTYDCEMEKSLHNLTIDSDGTLRTCLRINGGMTIHSIDYADIFGPDGELKEVFITRRIELEKKAYCQGCNHTCVMMSKYINDHEDTENKIVSH